MIMLQLPDLQLILQNSNQNIPLLNHCLQQIFREISRAFFSHLWSEITVKFLTIKIQVHTILNTGGIALFWARNQQ
ncbi:MAG: hypothetical protein CMA09_02745 [Euryarchaeota archaeon]|nr:hypothetical protein [Euryarchaeota archaeon]